MSRPTIGRRLARLGLALSLGLVAVGIFGLVATAATPPGFKTTKRAYLVPTASGVVTDPILSTGDLVGGYQMSGIPDGIGAYKDKGDLQVLFNHELGATFPGNPPGVNTRISKVTLNDKTHGALAGTYLFNGSEGFERFCSSTLAVIKGTPYYLTGEEAINAGHDGSSIVMNAETGAWTETPHFGHIQHENVVPVDVKKKSILVALDAAGVKIADIVEDAVRRDRALDTYERVLLKNLEQLRGEKEREIKQLEETIARSRAEIDREQKELDKWCARKRLEENRIAETVGYFVSANPITAPAVQNNNK